MLVLESFFEKILRNMTDVEVMFVRIIVGNFLADNIDLKRES